MSLKIAYRQIGFMFKHFMVRKRSKNPKDLFCLERAYEEAGEYASMVQLKNQQHIEQVIEDKNITKEYYSDEIRKDKRYLGLMQLGIEFLNMRCELEDLQEAHEIMHDKVQEELKKEMSHADRT